jgi:hypothetical protein
MAMYSDLLFAVSGDPIDVRASIYEIIAANKKKFLSWILHKKNKIFLAFPIFEFIWKKKKFILCKYLFYVC